MAPQCGDGQRPSNSNLTHAPSHPYQYSAKWTDSVRMRKNSVATSLAVTGSTAPAHAVPGDVLQTVS